MSEKPSIFFTTLSDLKESFDQGGVDAGSASDAGQGSALDSHQWFEENYEGELSVDVYETPADIVIRSTIAGVRPEDLEIYLQDDLLTIRGSRHQELETSAEYYCKECYWGGFSRSIVLPVEVQSEKVDATLTEGVLTIRLPKVQKSKIISVNVN